MKKNLILLWSMVVCSLISCSSSTPPHPNAEIFKTQPYIVNKSFHSVVPIDVWQNKIFLDATVQGQSHRFILDTGSPTILTKKVATALGLEVKGQNTGRDANGTPVTMELSILERLTIGGIEFRNIPVFIFDPPPFSIGHCLFDGGVIGSEILPLGVWQINFDRKELVLADSDQKLNYIHLAKKAPLKIGTYPFVPILSHQFNGAFRDHAMLDTGAPELFVLNEHAWKDLQKQKLVVLKALRGRGSQGESAGGFGKDTTFHLVHLNQLSIGEVNFNFIQVPTRTNAPSLIGAEIFNSHIVTLDYPNEMAYFHQYRPPLPNKASFGFRTYIKDQSAYVGMLWEHSVATEAGLQLHDPILKINGMDVSQIPESEYCKTQKKLLMLDHHESLDLQFRQNGQVKQATLQKR